MKFAIENIGKYNIDSTTVNYLIRDNSNNTINILVLFLYLKMFRKQNI